VKCHTVGTVLDPGPCPAHDRAVRIEIRGHSLPGRRCGGYDDVAVGVQRGREVVDVTPADADAATWSFEVTEVRRPDGATDVRGPWVHGRPGARFLYLSWSGTGGGASGMFRRAKLMLDDPALLAAAAGGVLVGRVGLTQRDGTPLCAAVRPPTITWTVGLVAVPPVWRPVPG
jgi:uncharacterized protein DUF5990